MPVGVQLVDENNTPYDSGNPMPVTLPSDTGPVMAPFGATLFTGATAAAMTGTTSTALAGAGAPGASKYNYITCVVVSNAHATVGTEVAIQDGNGGNTILTIPAAAAFGGGVVTLPVPIKQPTANTALYAKNLT